MKKAKMNRKSICVQILMDKEVETEDEIKQRQSLREGIMNTKYPLIIGNVEKLNSQICQLGRNMKNRLLLVCEEDNKRRLDEKMVESNSDAQKTNATCSLLHGYLTKTIEQNPQKRNAGPRFIETYQCPEFHENDQTPLPHDVSPKEMLEKALKAHYSPSKVPFRPTFDKILYSSNCQDILRDIFWHLYLSHFQSIPDVKTNLFHRVAINYVSLIQLARQTYFTDSFFQELPFLMPQAIYAAFLHCFADSSHHFDSSFKETTIQLVWIWMTGMNSSPGAWKKWNCKLLEPDNMIISESKLGSKKSKTWNPEETQNDQNPQRDSRTKKPEPSVKEDIQSPIPAADQVTSGPIQKNSTSKDDSLTAKVEIKEQNQLSKYGNIKKPKPNLVKTVFNVNGRCPLVQHFLRDQNAEMHSGTIIRVTRSQVDAL